MDSPAISETSPSTFSVTSFVVKFFLELEAVSLVKVITLAFLITELAAESIPKSTEGKLPNNKINKTADQENIYVHSNLLEQNND